MHLRTIGIEHRVALQSTVVGLLTSINYSINHRVVYIQQ